MKYTQIKNMFKEIKNKHICKIREDFKDQTENEIHYDMKALEEEIFKSKDNKLIELFLFFKKELTYEGIVMIDYHVDKLEFKGGLAIVPIACTTYIQKDKNIELDNIINGLYWNDYWKHWNTGTKKDWAI